VEPGGPWKCRVRGKRGKPNPGFPRFPPPLENPAEPAGFSHFHRPSVHRLEKWKTKNSFPFFHPAHATTMMFLSLNPKPKKGSRPLRGLLILETGSPSSRAKTDFMLIFQLENAALILSKSSAISAELKKGVVFE
jgi:hypothetical protein